MHIAVQHSSRTARRARGAKAEKQSVNSIPLVELDPHWFQRNGRAEGVVFDCPACVEPKRGHAIGVTWCAPSIHTSGAVWKVDRLCFGNMTLTPSINCDHGNGCTFHGFVTNGIVTW